MQPAIASDIPYEHTEEPAEILEQKLRQIFQKYNAYQLPFENGCWLEKIFAAWKQPHRYFHTLGHLLNICEAIEHFHPENLAETSQLLLIALFHDAVWFPWEKQNEARSAEAFDYVMNQLSNPLPPEAGKQIRQTILSTYNQDDISEMAAAFHDFDCGIILHGDAVDLLAYEFQIFKEFQYLNMSEYKKGRSAFFMNFAKKFPQCRQNMKFLVEFLQRRRPRIGIYAGTFHPFHIGHLSILEKTERMFDKVIVAVGINPEKNSRGINPGVDDVKNCLPFHEVVHFKGLMVDLLDQESAWSDVTLIRGLRNGYDLDYEMNQLQFMQEMRPDTHAVYIPCDKNLEHISSSALRSLKMFPVGNRDQIYFPKKYDYAHESIEQLFKI